MPVAIIGSGRSGTSLTARLLDICGLSLGRDERFSSANQDNVKGYWELVQLNQLNSRLLNHLGGTHDCPPHLEVGWEKDPCLDTFYRAAEDLIDNAFQDEVTWGWKDPRTTFLIPFWKALIPDLKFIICIRNPLAFVSSANVYGRSPEGSAPNDKPRASIQEIDRSLTFWHLACLTALIDTNESARILVNFEDYFPDYRKALIPLLDFLGIEQPVEGSDVDIACREFCAPQLRHHATSIDHLLKSNDVNSLIKELYSSLSAGDIDSHAQAQIDAGQDLQRPLFDTITYYECEHLEDVLSSRTHMFFDAIGRFLSLSKPPTTIGDFSWKTPGPGGSQRTLRLTNKIGMPISSFYLKLAGFLEND